MADIDIAGLENEINQLSAEDLRSQLLEAKVKQRVATKKYYNPENAKKLRQKRAKELTAMTERAKGAPATQPGFANLYDQIMAEAKTEADSRLAASAAEEDQGDSEGEVAAA